MSSGGDRMDVPKGHYRCAHCGAIEETTTSEEEMRAEFERNFGKPFAKAAREDSMAVVCDDCYQMMISKIPPPGIVESNQKERQ